MFKFLWQDYLRSYGSDEKRKGRLAAAFSSCAPWLGILISREGGLGSQASAYLGILVVLLPAIINIIALTGHPLSLPKFLYLCPMDSSERREFLERRYWFRVGIHMVLAVAVAAGMMVFFYCDIWTAVIFLTNLLFMSMMVMPENHSDLSAEQWLFFLQLLISTISEVLIAGIVLDAEPDTAFKIVLSGILLCIQLPAAIANRRIVKKRIEAASCFLVIEKN